MWFSVAVWTVLSSLVCSTVAYSSAHVHSGFPDYDSYSTQHDDDDWSFSSAQSAREPVEYRLLPEERSKREGHSLSIVNPLDVLRQRLMLEMARRRMKENQDQIRENAVILKNLGKRAQLRRRRASASEDYDE